MLEDNENTKSSELVYDGSTLNTGWENPPSLHMLQTDFNSAQSDNDHIERINRWLDHMKVQGEAKPVKAKGRSSYVNKLIKKNALWKYAPLSEPFLSTDNLIETKPITYEDIKSAEFHKLILNQQINNQLDKVEFFNELSRTITDEGTAIIRTGWYVEEVTEEEAVPVYEYIPQPEMGTVLGEVDTIYNEQPHLFHELPDEIQEAYRHYLRTGELVEAVLTGYENKEVTKTIANHPTWEIVEYDSIVYDPTCKGSLDKAKFVIHSTETSIAELTESGLYTNLDLVLLESNVSNVNDSPHIDDPSFHFTDSARKKLVMHEYWGYYDIHNNNTLVPIVCSWIGNVIVRMEESPYPDRKLPFVVIKHEPVKSELFGEPDAELLIDNQKVYSAVARGILDILGRSAVGQVGYPRGALDISNLSKFKRGEDFEYNGNMAGKDVFYMHNFPDISQAAPFMLQMQSTDAETLTGVKAFNSTGISGSAYGENVGGIRTALDAVSKREIDIIRRIGNGIKKVARKFSAMNAVFLSEEEVVRITNDRFKYIRRDDLQGNFDIVIDISSAEEDETKAQQLAFMLQATGDSDSPEIRKMILTKIAKLRKMPDLARELETFQPKPDPLAQQIQLLEIEERKAKVRKENALAEKALAEARKAGSDADMKDLSYVQEETGVTHTREVEKQQAQAEGNIQLELVKNRLERLGNNKSQPQRNEGKNDVET